MKLIIQIPCYNEEETLPKTLACLPRSLAGIDVIEWLIINDGSRDRTLEVARAHAVDHIVDLPSNMGLANAFAVGLARAIQVGGDIIVNTDADNQYDAADIPKLIAPILNREAEVVIGARPIRTIEHFSPIKKFLQRVGSWVVRTLSRTEVKDAPSGFRALSREAALRINIFDSYTYTLESIIQAGLSNIKVVSVEVQVNGETRPSRLIRSIPRYILRSSLSICRSLLIYSPGRTFFIISLVPLAMASSLSLRWLALYYADGGLRAHVPSLLVAQLFAIMAVILWACGLVGELLAINRRLLENIQYMLRKQANTAVALDASAGLRDDNAAG